MYLWKFYAQSCETINKTLNIGWNSSHVEWKKKKVFSHLNSFDATVLVSSLF